MRAVSSSRAGQKRALVLILLAGVFAGWLIVSVPAQVERFTASSNPDAGMQIADPGWGNGGGGG